VDSLAAIDRHLTARKPSALPDPQLIKQIGRGASVSHLKPVNIVRKTSAAATQKRSLHPRRKRGIMPAANDVDDMSQRDLSEILERIERRLDAAEQQQRLK
jgi:hypothetical protein